MQYFCKACITNSHQTLCKNFPHQQCHTKEYTEQRKNYKSQIQHWTKIKYKNWYFSWLMHGVLYVSMQIDQTKKQMLILWKFTCTSRSSPYLTSECSWCIQNLRFHIFLKTNSDNCLKLILTSSLRELTKRENIWQYTFFIRTERQNFKRNCQQF